MLQRIFESMPMFIIAAIIYWIGYSISLMWRFIVRAEAIISVYEDWKKMIESNVSSDKPNRFTYRERFYKIQIEFNSSLELSEKVLKIIEDALQYYNRLGYIADSVEGMREYKYKLDNMYDEIKQLRERLYNKDHE